MFTALSRREDIKSGGNQLEDTQEHHLFSRVAEYLQEFLSLKDVQRGEITMLTVCKIPTCLKHHKI